MILRAEVDGFGFDGGLVKREDDRLPAVHGFGALLRVQFRTYGALHDHRLAHALDVGLHAAPGVGHELT